MNVRFQLFFKEFSGIGGVMFYKDVEMNESPVVGDKFVEIKSTVERVYKFSPVSDVPIEVTAVLKKESVFRKFKTLKKKDSFEKIKEFVIDKLTSKGWSYSG